ncbi:hypothetical protein B0T19DRAFT_404731 [Cercophora scortea]|uniref:Uncharacterized protein n=1 Tax=Cercophora scortea TaxID=314031 RepID=A0AAE0I817_9PEZI|nr:hypothetical protein B0T19DRAFT_404731 [Cercophora scortea]
MGGQLWGPKGPLTIAVSVYAVVAALLAIIILKTKAKSPPCWVPSIFLTDGCLIPLYPFLLFAPAYLWPLVVVLTILLFIYRVLEFVWMEIFRDFNGLQSCCGIKRSARGRGNDDVEMGAQPGQPSSSDAAASGGVGYEQVEPTPQPSAAPEVIAQPDRPHLAKPESPPAYSEA